VRFREEDSRCARTLRDGPIWWHYRSVSGHSAFRHGVHAGDTYLMVAVCAGVVWFAAKGGRRVYYKLNIAAGTHSRGNVVSREWAH
jgi:hypothetical protein